MSDDRSERLRQRRKESQERVRESGSSEVSETAEASEPAEQSESSKPSKPDKPDETGDAEGDVDDSSVKEEQVGTYMYLPQSQKKELERLYNMLKAEYEYEYGEEFEKNRAFYPLVVKYGFESLDGLDASEIRERLDSL
ncbi:hypothetical protein [Haloarcula laminariae]|uniref:hypothetical protein n=1 Tax=Haloarcula laminariae TaxID=2961577 RepID=UPI0024049284|nr:hypothetical protein [Halomicroarcula sp. FL173]